MEIFNILYIYIYIYIDAAEVKLVSVGLAQARPNYHHTVRVAQVSVQVSYVYTTSAYMDYMH